MNQTTDITPSRSFGSIFSHLMLPSSHQQPDSTCALLGQVSVRNKRHPLLETLDCCSWEKGEFYCIRCKNGSLHVHGKNLPYDPPLSHHQNIRACFLSSWVMHKFWTVTSSGEGSHPICFLMFAFPEQLPAEIDAIRDLTREFSNLPTAINIKIFKKSRKENLGGGKRECQDSWTLGLKDEYYLGPFFSPVFDWLNLLVGKRILKSNKYSRFLNFSWFEFFKSLTVWLVIQHEYKQNEMTWDQSTGRLTIGTESTERKMQQEIKGKF